MVGAGVGLGPGVGSGVGLGPGSGVSPPGRAGVDRPSRALAVAEVQAWGTGLAVQSTPSRSLSAARSTLTRRRLSTRTGAEPSPAVTLRVTAVRSWPTVKRTGTRWK